MKAAKSTLLDLYTDYLIAGVGQTTATGFSYVLNNQVSQRYDNAAFEQRLYQFPKVVGYGKANV